MKKIKKGKEKGNKSKATIKTKANESVQTL